MTFLKQIDGRWQGRGNASPRDFFQSAEPGFYLDFSATAPLYQDNVGATPLTLPDQQVGMALDVSRGMELGPELVTNGDFSAGATGWALGAGWSVSGGAAVSAGGGNAALSQSGGTYAAGRTYQVTFNITVSSGYLLAYVANGNNALISTSGAISLRLVASASGGLALFGFSFVGSIGNISAREVKSVPATQATLGLRPKWGRAPNVVRNKLKYTNQFDNAVWNSANTGGAGAAPVVTPNAGLAPDGTMTAVRVVFSLGGGLTTSDISRRRQVTTAASAVSGTGTYSFWAKTFDGVSSVNLLRENSDGFLGGNQVTVSGTWQRFTLTSSTYTVGSSVGFGLRGGQTPALPNAADILVWNAQLESGSTATADQKVTTATDITEAGFPSFGFMRPDLFDDVLTVTTPAAQTGDVMVFGRSGSWLQTGVAYGSGAAVTVGPKNLTGLPDNILSAIGDIVGLVAIGRTLTDAERAAAVAYYKTRGAVGLLAAGAELWSNVGVIVGAGWTEAGGVYAHSSGGDTFRKDIGLVTGKTYQVTFTVSGRVAGSIAPVFGGSVSNPVVTANGTFTQVAASGVNPLLYFQPSTDFVGSVSNISVKPLTVTP